MDSGTAVISFLLAVGVGLVILLVLRAVMLWYWKINTIVGELEYLRNSLDILTHERRKQYRIDYYTAVSMKDNQQAYKSLMSLIMDDLLKTRMSSEERKKLYGDLKAQHTTAFERAGYTFPHYELLF